jgi:D-alanine-D-alanine ligase
MTERGYWRGKRVGVLMGGTSNEREISLESGTAVHAALLRNGYDAVAVDTRDGLPEALERIPIDVAFIALHGRLGEDGRAQGFLEVIGVPYTGSGVQASAVAMDKLLTKRLFRSYDLPTPNFWVVNSPEEVTALLRAFEQPLVVKPVYEGSTLGIAVVRSADQVEAALRSALGYGRRIFIEAFVAGREITCGVLNGDPLPLVEIRAPGGFFDYQAKYRSDHTEYLVPAPLPEAVSRDIQRACAKAAAALGCRGGVRVDVMVDAADNYFLLEVNTVPGMTTHSLLPKAAAAIGIDFHDLVERLLDGIPQERD